MWTFVVFACWAVLGSLGSSRAHRYTLSQMVPACGARLPSGGRLSLVSAADRPRRIATGDMQGSDVSKSSENLLTGLPTAASEPSTRSAARRQSAWPAPPRIGRMLLGLRMGGFAVHSTSRSPPRPKVAPAGR